MSHQLCLVLSPRVFPVVKPCVLVVGYVITHQTLINNTDLGPTLKSVRVDVAKVCFVICQLRQVAGTLSRAISTNHYMTTTPSNFFGLQTGTVAEAEQPLASCNLACSRNARSFSTMSIMVDIFLERLANWAWSSRTVVMVVAGQRGGVLAKCGKGGGEWVGGESRKAAVEADVGGVLFPDCWRGS